VDPSAPAQSAFTLQANHSISGRVSIYDRASRQEIPVAGVAVILQEISRECTTDGNGVYLFRDLPPGAYSVVVVHQGEKTQKNVTLPDYPAFPKNIDIHLVAD
jgi:hypothetical protein